MDTRPGDSVFETLGIEESERRVYLTLLGGTPMTSEEVARSTGLSPSEVDGVVSALEAKGLTSHEPGSDARFRAADPSVALEALILRHQQRLDDGRASISALAKLYRESGQRARVADQVDVVRGREAVARRAAQLQLAAEREVLTFVKPPFVQTSNLTELEMLPRGVRYRSLYDRAALEYPGIWEVALELQAAGEKCRTYPELPLKAIIVDDRSALIPLSLDQPGMEEGGLVIHSSSVLEALVTLFDILWRSAVPLGITELGTVKGLPEECEPVLALMIGGLKDDAIARRLEVSKTTIDRRVRKIFEHLGGSTRFQTGFMAGSRLNPEVDSPAATTKSMKD